MNEDKEFRKTVDDEGYYNNPQEETHSHYDRRTEQYVRDSNTKKEENCRIPVWIFMFLLVILVLDVVSMKRFPNLLNEYKGYKTAESRIQNGETSLALIDLYELAEKYPGSEPIIKKSIELSMENGYYDLAGYLHDTYLIGMELSDLEYVQFHKYFTRLESYYKTYDAVEQIYSTSTNIDNNDDKYFEDVKIRIKALLDESGQDLAYIYYYLGMLEVDLVSAKNYMQMCYNNDQEYFDARVQLGVMYRRLGEYDKATHYNKEALAKNKLDSGALRSEAIIKMLEGDLKSGVTYAQDAYSSDPDGSYIRETYLIALTKNDMKEEANIIREEIIELYGALDEDTIKLLNGEITLNDYYIGG